MLDDRDDALAPSSNPSDESSGTHVSNRQNHKKRNSHEGRSYPPSPEPLSGQKPKGLMKLDLDSEAVNAVWAPIGSSHPAPRESANRIMEALKRHGGNIMYHKGNYYQQVHFIGDKPFYQYVLVPDQLLSQHDAKFDNTIISNTLVRRAALELMSYEFRDGSFGEWVIDGDLPLVSLYVSSIVTLQQH